MTLLVFVVALLVTIAMGIPIAYALLLSGLVLMYYMGMLEPMIVAQNVIHGADSFPLMAVPFFMLAGEIMNAGGLARRIINFAMALVGHVRGGLGYVTILASCLLASVSGSAIADAAALGALLIPMMVQAGHNKERAAGLVAAGGIIAPVIPPSIGLVIFGVAANVSISRLFMAGIVPGLLLGVGLCFAWYIVSRREEAARTPRRSRAEVWVAFKEGIWALILPFIIVFGLRFGIFTPTEAGVVVAVYALFVSVVIYREMKLPDISRVFVNAAITTSIVMFMMAAALVSSWLITVSQIATQVVELSQPFLDSPILLMIVLMLIILIVGMVLDMIPTILIFTPILMPIVREAGIDPVYFGVMFIINVSIGLITPPVGSVLNVVCGVAKLKMQDLLRGVAPFWVAHVLVLLLLSLFPMLVIAPARWLSG